MKWLKYYKSFESKTDVMYEIYDAEEIDKLDRIIDDIKDILLELTDNGLFTTVGYTPMTLVGRENLPKVMVEIQSSPDAEYNQVDSEKNGDKKWISNGKDLTGEVSETIQRLKSYVKSTGYPFGDGDWVSTSSNKRIYQMLIQK